MGGVAASSLRRILDPKAVCQEALDTYRAIGETVYWMEAAHTKSNRVDTLLENLLRKVGGSRLEGEVIPRMFQGIPERDLRVIDGTGMELYWDSKVFQAEDGSQCVQVDGKVAHWAILCGYGNEDFGDDEWIAFVGLRLRPLDGVSYNPGMTSCNTGLTSFSKYRFIKSSDLLPIQDEFRYFEAGREKFGTRGGVSLTMAVPATGQSLQMQYVVFVRASAWKR